MFKTINFPTFLCLLCILISPSCNDNKLLIDDIKIYLSQNSLSLSTGDTLTLSATIKDNPLSQKLYWASTDNSVAMIDSLGQVVATGAGKASIIATVGAVKASCKVSVSPSLYVAGYIENSDGTTSGIIWRNNKELLTIESSQNSVYLNNIEVLYGKALTAGTIQESTTSAPCGMIWLADSTYEDYGNGYTINSLTLDNISAKPTLYAAATSSITTPTSATILNSGETATLEGGSGNSTALSIATNDSDITMVVGSATNSNGIESPALWNSTTLSLLSESSTDNGAATDIFINGENVYISGYVGTNAIVWTNSTADTLSTGTSSYTAVANAIYYYEDMTYTAGYIIGGIGTPIPVYWLGSEMIPLTEAGTGEALDIAVMDGNIYISGYQYDGSTKIATLWKNGSPTLLSASTSVNSCATALKFK